MSLSTYKKKRKFNDTPEPTGGKGGNGALRFVVQKHDASRLHYDFRLELKGVLKSWAVPKGPSLDPSVKRLAMMTEDHPMDYRNFEGIIPKGNYGAGSVIVWDEGEYQPISADENAPLAQQEKMMWKELKSGSVKVRLSGKKLKGEFALVKTKQAENSWLLIKHRDAHASEKDITKKNKSVVSGKTLETLEKTSDNTQKTPTKKPAAQRKSTAEKNAGATGGKSAFPKKPSPMLATLAEHPPENGNWIYELKWDGYRALAAMKGAKTDLLSRNGKSFNEKFFPVYDAVKNWKINAVVDGEIVVMKNNLASFSALQNWRSEADGDLYFYVFDIIWHDGKDLTALPLSERRALLENLIPEQQDIIRFSKSFEAEPEELLDAVSKMGMEGIMAKKENSLYQPGERTKDWLKLKTNRRHEVVIGGFTRNEGSPKAFSSLLVGVYENGHFVYTGKIGTGFSDELQKELLRKFKPLQRKTSPFDAVPDVNKKSRFRPDPPHATATWLRPSLVCEVSYTEVTEDGLMRHPAFAGMRTDKKAKEVTREIPTAPPAVGNLSEPGKKPNKKTVAEKKTSSSAKKNSRINDEEKNQQLIIRKKEIALSNLDKWYWKESGIRKRDLLQYYEAVAPYMLPYLKNRPQSLNRHPNGYKGKHFYQKDVTGKVPDWIKLHPYQSEDSNQRKNFMVCMDEADLLYMANLGCIEINPWSSTVKKPDHPDWCLLDIDPDKHPFSKVVETVLVAREILDNYQIPSWCKTSGSTGMHIYIPLNAKYTYEQSKEFARVLVTLIHREIPGFTSIERQVSKRKGKIYLDFLQNRPQATLAAPYSVRPKPGATVSTPLHWEEVNVKLKMQDFHLRNAPDMLKERGDIFKGVLGKGLRMETVIKRIGKQ